MYFTLFNKLLSLDAPNCKGWAKLNLKRWVKIGYDNRVVAD